MTVEKEKKHENQNISSVGYHYYMTQKMQNLGLKYSKINLINRLDVDYNDYPDLSKMKVFNK